MVEMSAHCHNGLTAPNTREREEEYHDLLVDAFEALTGIVNIK